MRKTGLALLPLTLALGACGSTPTVTPVATREPVVVATPVEPTYPWEHDSDSYLWAYDEDEMMADLIDLKWGLPYSDDSAWAICSAASDEVRLFGDSERMRKRYGAMWEDSWMGKNWHAPTKAEWTYVMDNACD